METWLNGATFLTPVCMFSPPADQCRPSHCLSHRRHFISIYWPAQDTTGSFLITSEMSRIITSFNLYHVNFSISHQSFWQYYFTAVQGANPRATISLFLNSECPNSTTEKRHKLLRNKMAPTLVQAHLRALRVWFQITALKWVTQICGFPGAYRSYVYTIL